MVRRKQIRLMVQKLLAQNEVFKPPVPVRDIAINAGVRIKLHPADDDLSGFLYRDTESQLAVIGVNSKQVLNRQTFTIAHELGHFFLHDFKEVHVDRKFKVWLRNETSSQGTDEEEKEANLFAAELLMPLKFLSRDVDKNGIDDVFDPAAIEALAEKYHVSTHAMTIRLNYLGYISQ